MTREQRSARRDSGYNRLSQTGQSILIHLIHIYRELDLLPRPLILIPLTI